MHIQQLQSQIAEAHAEFRRGIDRDWKASVLRYPEVLDYFYSLVEFKLPGDNHPSVVEPPFAVAGYQDRGYMAGESSRLGSEKPRRKKRRDSAGAMGHPGVHMVRTAPLRYLHRQRSILGMVECLVITAEMRSTWRPRSVKPSCRTLGQVNPVAPVSFACSTNMDHDLAFAGVCWGHSSLSTVHLSPR